MTDTLNGRLLVALLAWSLVWLLASAVGLNARPADRWRGFWFMSALWAGIDGAIAWVGLVRPPLADAELAPILLVNIGLGVGYVVAGAVLVTRRRPLLRGFGLAVLLQGGYLLAQDGVFYRLATRA